MPIVQPPLPNSRLMVMTRFFISNTLLFRLLAAIKRPFFEFFHFIDDHSQCEDEGQGIGGRTGSEHTDNTHRLGQQQGDRDEKHDLSGQRDDG